MLLPTHDTFYFCADTSKGKNKHMNKAITTTERLYFNCFIFLLIDFDNINRKLFFILQFDPLLQLLLISEKYHFGICPDNN
jgi:hypothetical protein